ncbi:fumarate/nitrate reduction transcriptional regulator Fnr [Burkholderia cenocepacia]|uniref:fumarate/nitrate reduction transcriptional regulator Fnr n=1 Tax=Burkholderia cenocepacia TaxID=95486 RepID=UPI001CF1B2AF|nr:fumarate/nitrate reduction transcriptional regulator Fnr [Burkholderia cenocepacia]MCA8236071.1 fumarate/nitrate reduction transcriptional regulator Fnr [Burkholderia cenocepacia]
MLTPVATRPAATPNAGSWAPRQAPHCSSCAMRHLCMPQGLAPEALSRLESVICAARPVKRGEALFREGDAFDNLYAVRSGSLKTVATRHDGREQVTGLHLAGEALGLDGICDDTHPRTAVALEDSSVCVIPYSALKALCSEAGSMQLRMHKLMSEQIVRETSQTMLLGSLNAEERVAAFLLDVSSRYLKRGYSPSEFNLRMTREDIGSYLGMTLETVSRTLSKFQKRGLIEMQGRHVQIVDFDGLQHL